MDLIFKSFLGLFFIMELMVGGVSLICGSLASRNANAYLIYSVEKMKAAGYDEEVCEECVEEAESNGYLMEMDSDEDVGLCRLRYPIRLMPFGINLKLEAIQPIIRAAEDEEDAEEESPPAPGTVDEDETEEGE